MSLLSKTYSGRRVLITGHTGFKGSWMSLWMIGLGAHVCGYSNGIPTVPSLFESSELAAHLRHEVGDIRDHGKLNKLIQDFKPDFIFHLAAQRAGWCGQHNGKPNLVVANRDIADHVEGDQIFFKIRFDHISECIDD